MHIFIGTNHSYTPSLHFLPYLYMSKVNMAVFCHITVLLRLLLVSFKDTASRREALFKTNI